MASYAPRQPRTAEDLSDPQYWEHRNDGYLCRACGENNVRSLKRAVEHERTSKHRTNVNQHERARRLSLERQRAQPAGPQPQLDPATVSAVDLLSASLMASRAAHIDTQPTFGAAPLVPDPISVNMNDVDFGDDANLDLPQEDLLSNAFTMAIHRGMESGVFIDPGSDDESLDVPLSESSGDEEGVDSVANLRGPLRASTVPPTAPYFPWSDKPEFTLDTAPHLTRSALSERELDLVTWCMQVNEVPNLRSVSAMKNVHKRLQATFGIETVEYAGKMGHKYFVNSLSDIIAQEYANPLVGPYLQSLPVDHAPNVSQAFEAQKWLNEIDPNLAAPMIRRGEGQDFYIFEPALLTGGEACVPHRWFIRAGERFARAWRLTSEYYVDPGSGQRTAGWCVHEYETLEISESRFLVSMPELAKDHHERSLPHPSHIIGSFLTSADRASQRLSNWTHSDPVVGNPRRAQARGCVIQSFPMWLYCDDTSGNQSKKWNKHNSFLFTAAGLPREKAHQEYNVHFLTTSNTAPVPEMLDGVVSEIEKSQEHGIWAFDFRTRQIVFVIPFVLALLGDNPMQSELACHIGLRGRFFCRACWVYKHDGAHAADVPGNESAGDSEGSEDEMPSTSARRKVKESMAEMLDRVKRFVSPARPRTRESTLAAIDEIQEAAMSATGQERTKALKTQSGIKDTALQFWIDKLVAAMKGKRGPARQTAFDRVHAQLPQGDLRSAIWRLRGVDPNCDTPVEVLHVILLGIVKYFWRDAVKNHCKSDSKKNTLIARLDSFDTTGLGIAPLRGHTLVTYAGSLVGRDFRAIVQVAPFVLHGLVPAPCYEAWTALAALVPVVWVPEIVDIGAYTTRLTVLINNLLATTAAWTPRWFSKPKFHILLHLPDHVRRFGPALLFATEAFESYNAVIRTKSIHSNRQAPSRDIARAFAHSNRIRHCLSGGYFRPQTFVQTSQTGEPIVVTREETRRQMPSLSDFHPAGARVLQLAQSQPILRTYLGLPDPLSNEGQNCAIVLSKDKVAVQFQATRCYNYMHTHPTFTTHSPALAVHKCTKIKVPSGDVYRVGTWFLAEVESSPPALYRIVEILTSLAFDDVLLLAQRAVVAVQERVDPYKMPRVYPMDIWDILLAKRILCPANVQHNCARNDCKPSSSRPLRQERSDSQELQALISHTRNPADLILNTAKMRDANNIQAFSRIMSYDLMEMVQDGVQREFPVQSQSLRSATASLGAGTR